MTRDWAQLEAHVVNGAFPLQRCVGSTDHSGVFLTQATKHAPSAVALKLIPLEPDRAPAQLAQWRGAVELSHPHLLRMFEAGECRLEGADYLFARMEYADQTLAQVLERRALTEEEAREMLGPMVDALAYLHDRQLAHGGLRPSNVLVVGDRLKLASDTVRAFDETDPEASIASDLWALGATVCEATTRVRPSETAQREGVVLPPGLPAAFHGLVSRALHRDAERRPTAAQWRAWLNGKPAAQVAAAVPSSSPARLVIRVELPSEQEAHSHIEPPRPTWRVIPLVVAGLVVLGMGWVGYRALRPPAPAAAPAPAPAEPPPATLPVPVPPPAPGTVAEPPPPAPPASSDAPLQQVLPNVSQSALESVRGTVRVSVRVAIDRSGNVVAATADDPGPSAYFLRRSIEAAKQWKFPPSSSEERRAARLRFAFTRAGATASAETTRP